MTGWLGYFKAHRNLQWCHLTGSNAGTWGESFWMYRHFRPKDVTVTVSVYCQHGDNLVLDKLLLSSAFRVENACYCFIIIIIIKAYMKFEAVASHLWQTGPSVLQLLFLQAFRRLFFCCCFGFSFGFCFHDKCCFDCITQSCKTSLFWAILTNDSQPFANFQRLSTHWKEAMW